MNPYLLPLAALLTLPGLAQTPPALPGRTYLAKVGNACAETTTGGCWETFYYRLRFGRDSVTVTYVVRSVCSGRGEATTTRTDTTQTQRRAYYVLDEPRQVVIAGFPLGPLTSTANGLLSEIPLHRDGPQAVFELNAVLPRPGD